MKFTYHERHLLNLYVSWTNHVMPGGESLASGKQNPRLIALFLSLASKDAALKKTD